MGAAQPRLIALGDAERFGPELVGQKAVNLARLAGAAHSVPDGVGLTVHAYESFVQASGLLDVIRMELGRKSLGESRWEEIWDAAHRIRAAFLAAPCPPDLAAEIIDRVGPMLGLPLAVRSSAPGEDSETESHAGLHESVTDVLGAEQLITAIRIVWASLWSDAALLYRKEIGLDAASSRMAVVVQPMVSGGPSGVAFGRDPRDAAADRAIVEAVPGPCSELVDGSADPDRYVMRRSTWELLDFRRGERVGSLEPLLTEAPLFELRDALARAEELLSRPPDVEWTFGSGVLTLLQARPITPAAPKDQRTWYLSLTPGDEALRRLARQVSEQRIPELKSVGDRLAAADLAALDDPALAAEIEGRAAHLENWRAIYEAEFIPFAHGVRRLAIYYQEAVRPADPYEFVGLLTGQELLAGKRNRALAELGAELRADEALRRVAGAIADGHVPLSELSAVAGGERLRKRLLELCSRELDVEYAGERMGGRPEVVLHLLLEGRDAEAAVPNRGSELLARLLGAVGPDREAQAREILEIGRLSWRLRDDDNLLLGRLESQLLRAIEEGVARLVAAGRVDDPDRPGENAAATVAGALRSPEGGVVRIPAAPRPSPSPPVMGIGEKARQLIGQPSSPGIATGPVCRIRDLGDLARFKSGDVLVCDAIQPQITHVVPLAAAVVERRGGMLIHGAIIARELGIPCVNGIPRVSDLLEDGETVTVDGWLGIVTVGEAEFELER